MQHFPLTEKLHTDVLEEKYGFITAKVLKHNDRIRESLLIDPKGIARTYALTFFSDWKSNKIKKINNEIKKGESIGKAFRKEGFTIRKNVLDVFILDIPLWLRKSFKTKEKTAKARLSEFYAKKHGQKPVIYGIVTEIYSPDFRKPVVNEVDLLQVSALSECLENNGFSREEIYRRIGDENNYEDSYERYQKAKRESLEKIELLRLKVKKELLTAG